MGLSPISWVGVHRLDYDTAVKYLDNVNHILITKKKQLYGIYVSN